MASRSSKIKVLLAIDILFFFVELISGYAVGSLALVADSFHMLNDVMSLIVALYAIKLTETSESDSRYSYGWHRAEIVAALINGVFLLALCFSLSLEALERFINKPEISNPRLVVIVGCFGLASNLVGLFLFHEHTHSHSHSHSHSYRGGAESSPHVAHASNNSKSGVANSKPKPTADSDADDESDVDYGALAGHPAMTRASISKVAHHMHKARENQARSSSHDSFGEPSSHPQRHSSHDLHRSSQVSVSVNEETPLLRASSTSPVLPLHPEYDASAPAPAADDSHSHSHGHSHAHSSSGSMNMRALVLHVLGDALGNVGVIATGLIIWHSSWQYKYYFDPAISLVITVIILASALPLVRSATFVLLQGVPSTISLENVRKGILEVEGVLSLHELHIWQLSESKNIASVHVLASRDLDFMPIAAQIRRVLHDQGIHSCTIQPEYYGSYFMDRPERDHEHDQRPGIGKTRTDTSSSCLVRCPPNQEDCNPRDNSCCPPPPADV